MNGIIYNRDASGCIERTHRTGTRTQQMDTPERLLGWPETTVFWHVMADGSAVGIAVKTLE